MSILHLAFQIEVHFVHECEHAILQNLQALAYLLLRIFRHSVSFIAAFSTSRAVFPPPKAFHASEETELTLLVAVG
jgi:hypothetical protein